MPFVKKSLTQEEIIMQGLLAFLSCVVPVQMRYDTSRRIRKKKKKNLNVF